MQTIKQKLLAYEKRAQEIEKLLLPWRGMTFREAKKHGWGSQQTELQSELWLLGYKILALEKALTHN